MTTAKPKRTKISRKLLVDALVWNCPFYTRDGFVSRCNNMDGTYSNCVKDQCSQVNDIFKTMAKIDAGEIEVF
jgi:hypothetical protein